MLERAVERRIVSVLFADLVGFTSLSEQLDAEDVASVQAAYFDTVRETVVEGDRVTLADFGTFERKHRNRRIARNPRQPEVPIVVPERDLPSFTPGKEFRYQVLGNNSG